VLITVLSCIVFSFYLTLIFTPAGYKICLLLNKKTLNTLMDMIQDLLYHPIKLSSIFLITILPALGFALMMYNMVIALP